MTAEAGRNFCGVQCLLKAETAQPAPSTNTQEASATAPQQDTEQHDCQTVDTSSDAGSDGSFDIMCSALELELLKPESDLEAKDAPTTAAPTQNLQTQNTVPSAPAQNT